MISSDDQHDFSIYVYPNKTEKVCFNRPITDGSNLWLESSAETTLPQFVLQFAIILTLNRILLAAAASCHLPRIVANIFTGFLLGQSVMGGWHFYDKHIFPFTNMLPLETLGAMALVYYVFLLGLEIDLKHIKRCHSNKKATVVAIAGIIFTLPVGGGLYYLLVTDMGRNALSPSDKVKHIRGAIIWGITLSCCGDFPEIASILSHLKLLLTENGQLALAASTINDLYSWTLIVLTITEFYYHSVSSMIFALMFLLTCFFFIHPIAKWLFNMAGTRDREFLESQVVFLLHFVLAVGLLADGLGAHSITGAFLLGVVLPKGVVNNAVQDKVLDFVAAFMMPLFFVAIGERMKIQVLALDSHWTTVVIVIVLAFIAKILCTFVVSCIYQMPIMEGLSLSLLMNTKGMMSLIILSTARDRLELDHQTYGVMLVACWFMTVAVGPVLAAARNPITTSYWFGSQSKTIQGTRQDSPLKVLACVHTKRDANVIINLLNASCPSVKSPIEVMAVELVKMANRPTSSLIVRNAQKPASFTSSKSTKPNSFKKNDTAEDDDTLGCFDNLRESIFTEKMRVVSSYNSMHKDIFNLARISGVTLILTTLYKQPTYDDFGAGHATARAVNIINRDNSSRDKKKVVLEHLVKETPCCLAIFVDRGFGQKRAKEQRLAMFYVGGADDREALSYAWRMSRNQEVQLTVVRLVWDNPEDEFDEMDKEYINEFVQQTVDTPRLKYLEKVVKDEKETVMLLNKMGNKGFDLYIVGRGHGRKMSLAQTLEPVLEEPALGPLGDALSDLNSAAKTSILILQRQPDLGDDHSSRKHVHSSSGQFLDIMLDQHTV
ncbi:cation/H(+) antiporter 15-like [Gastrolobium bilobum]|uniref:cation/H(+) antiporter 15-like n=1 Tax=Gastrolobium bilobum TaxID=150636 RepID=UPI002AB14D11|nr:cation/H(+) antiporter 15-like [Gastrolobium bilobum]